MRHRVQSLALFDMQNGAIFLMKHLNVTSDSLYPAQHGPRVCNDSCSIHQAQHASIPSNLCNPPKHSSSSFLSRCSRMFTARLGEGAARQWSSPICSTSGALDSFACVCTCTGNGNVEYFFVHDHTPHQRTNRLTHTTKVSSERSCWLHGQAPGYSYMLRLHIEVCHPPSATACLLSAMPIAPIPLMMKPTPAYFSVSAFLFPDTSTSLSRCRDHISFGLKKLEDLHVYYLRCAKNMQSH